MARTRDAEQSGAARRAKIIAAAGTLFADRGYRGTSLEAVATAAGITRPGLLHHFSSKETLLTAVLAELDLQAFEEVDVDRDYQGPAVHRALDIVDELAVRSQKHRELTRLGQFVLSGSGDTPQLARDWSVQRVQTFRDHLGQVVDQGIEAGEVRADADSTAIALVVIGAMTGLAELWLQDESIDMAGAMRALTDMLRRDLVGPAEHTHS
ncbi:TetR/AcrR family transcriptional regulator [Nocardia sp. NPDC051990]|uniref:TetR/AcrR family transcriptional regulator n=1 Tax=Nocardia sp. NPDC051990 TaxID=3155285 RepID=UPI003432B63C